MNKCVHEQSVLGGAGVWSAVENPKYLECMKCTEMADSARERPGVTWREWSSWSVRSTVELAERPWSPWSITGRLGVRGCDRDHLECPVERGLPWTMGEGWECRGTPWSGAEPVERRVSSEACEVRRSAEETWSMWSPRSTTESAECRGVPRSTRSTAE